MIELHHGDNLDIFPLIEDESVDTVITDSPYGLKFMGKDWDHGVPGVRTWAECLRVAKPGAMLCAFGGTRTHHRLMCAIEDAGWEIRDVLMWVYGSGFPKSHDISKAIDKAAGAEREVVGFKPIAYPDSNCWGTPNSNSSNKGVFAGHIYGDGEQEVGFGKGSPITAPATDAAALWDGWGTALKPAYEPIILAMKPLPGTFAQNALGYGVAGLWVDGCRVGVSDSDRAAVINSTRGPQQRMWKGLNTKGEPVEYHPQGRWPANLLLSHAPGCECVGVRKVKNGRWGKDSKICSKANDGTVAKGKQYEHQTTGYASPDGTETIGDWICVEGCPVRMLDEQSGERRGGNHNRHNRGNEANGNTHIDYGQYGDCLTTGHNDTGGASRFFTRFHYSAKASRAERELGLLGHIPCLKCGLLDSVTHMNPKTGKEEKCRRNGHPTVKPLDVCRWLCRLTRTPTGGVVLDPFMGSGRIPMAAILEGRDTIGIELERPSFEIAQAAVQWAQEQVPEMIQARLAV